MGLTASRTCIYPTAPARRNRRFRRRFWDPTPLATPFKCIAMERSCLNEHDAVNRVSIFQILWFLWLIEIRRFASRTPIPIIIIMFRLHFPPIFFQVLIGLAQWNLVYASTLTSNVWRWKPRFEIPNIFRVLAVFKTWSLFSPIPATFSHFFYICSCTTHTILGTYILLTILRDLLFTAVENFKYFPRLGQTFS